MNASFVLEPLITQLSQQGRGYHRVLIRIPADEIECIIGSHTGKRIEHGRTSSKL